MGDKVKEVSASDIAGAQLRQALVQAKTTEQQEVLTVLEQLRRSRKARGGVGAPLAVPAHLRDAAAGHGIIVTDRDLNQNATPKTREEESDEASDVARHINDAEKHDR